MSAKKDSLLTGRWSFSVDRGGTFTDIIGVAPNGQIHVQKILSKTAADPDATLVGIRKILDESGNG